MSLIKRILFNSSLNNCLFINRSIRLRCSSSGTSELSGEDKLSSLLRFKFPKAKAIHVEDISGGCGAMYEVSVVSPEFKGLNLLKQHRLVTEALKAEVKDMHGIRIHTAVTQNES